MNKTQIKKIKNLKSLFVKSERFTLDHLVKNMLDGRTKNLLIDTYEYLLVSFKKEESFQDCVNLYEERSFETKQDYVDFVSSIKKFAITN